MYVYNTYCVLTNPPIPRHVISHGKNKKLKSPSHAHTFNTCSCLVLASVAAGADARPCDICTHFITNNPVQVFTSQYIKMTLLRALVKGAARRKETTFTHAHARARSHRGANQRSTHTSRRRRNGKHSLLLRSCRRQWNTVQRGTVADRNNGYAIPFHHSPPDNSRSNTEYHKVRANCR